MCWRARAFVYIIIIIIITTKHWRAISLNRLYYYNIRCFYVLLTAQDIIYRLYVMFYRSEIQDVCIYALRAFPYDTLLFAQHKIIYMYSVLVIVYTCVSWVVGRREPTLRYNNNMRVSAWIRVFKNFTFISHRIVVYRYIIIRVRITVLPHSDGNIRITRQRISCCPNVFESVQHNNWIAQCRRRRRDLRVLNNTL